MFLHLTLTAVNFGSSLHYFVSLTYTSSNFLFPEAVVKNGLEKKLTNFDIYIFPLVCVVQNNHNITATNSRGTTTKEILRSSKRMLMWVRKLWIIRKWKLRKLKTLFECSEQDLRHFYRNFSFVCNLRVCGAVFF